MEKTAVVIGATGFLGTSIVAELKRLGFVIDETWTSRERPDVRFKASYSSLPKEIDLAVYAAGTNIICPAHELTENNWDEVIDINLKGAFLFAQECFDKMKFRENATIVMISSINSLHPYPGRLPYSVSKAGIEALVRCLAVEWGPFGISSHGIRLGHLDGIMKNLKVGAGFHDAIKANTPSGKLVDVKAVGSYIGWLYNHGAESLSGTVIDFEPAYTINRFPLAQNGKL